MILAYADSDDNLRTTKDIAYDLKLGQVWERILVDNLTALGFRSSQPKQQLNQNGLKASLMANRGKTERAAELRSKVDRTMLRPFQLDVVATLGKTRYNIEVKALTPAAFRQPVIHVGLTEKYDLKRVRVDVLVLINQTTGVAWVCPPKEEWQRIKAIEGQGIDYAVPRSSLAPLQAWADAALDIYSDRLRLA